MKQLNLIFLFIFIYSFSAFSNYHDNEYSFEGPETGGTMGNFPIHFMRGMNGGLSIIYGLGTGAADMANGMSGGMGMGPAPKVEPLMYMVMPMSDLGGDSNRKIVNLSTNPLTNLLIPYQIDSEKGYKVVDQKRIEAGFGLMGMAAPTSVNWGLFASVGIMPKIGGSIYAERFAKDKDAIHELPKIRIPHNLEELDKLKIGDKIAYSVNGGVMFSAGVGVTILGDLGFMFVAEGSWKVRVKKIDSSKLKVEIKKEKVVKFMGALNTAITNLGVGVFGSSDKSFGFIFDFKDEAAIKAFRDMIFGDLIHAQKMAQALNPNVTQVSKGYSKKHGLMFNAGVGLSVLGKVGIGKMKMSSFSKNINLLNGMTVISYMGMDMETRRTEGFLSDHKYKGFEFMGMVMEMRPAKKMKIMNESMKKMLAGNIGYIYEKNKMSVKKLKKEIKALIRRFGFEKELNFTYPIEKKLGYTRLDLNINISEKATKKFMSLWDNQDLFLTELNEDAKAMIDEWFLTGKDLQLVCRMKVISKKNCKKLVIKRTKNAIGKALKALGKMKQKITNQNFKAFASEYAHFLKHSGSNRFSFATIFSNISISDYKVRFKLMGENIPQINTSF